MKTRSNQVAPIQDNPITTALNACPSLSISNPTKLTMAVAAAAATAAVAAAAQPPSLYAHCSWALGWASFKLCEKKRWGLRMMTIKGRRERGVLVVVNGAAAASEGSADEPDVWVLEPVGDGDWRHIGSKVEMPGAYEIVSSMVTVGRVPEKANLVIPVATVSGLHARLQKKEGSLYITDLDSTNGTFLDEERLRPGAIVRVRPGSCITFGDTHLAMFRASKLDKPKVVEQNPEPEREVETEVAVDSSDSTS